jgi:hypothetical protein
MPVLCRQRDTGIWRLFAFSQGEMDDHREYFHRIACWLGDPQRRIRCWL